MAAKIFLLLTLLALVVSAGASSHADGESDDESGSDGDDVGEGLGEFAQVALIITGITAVWNLVRRKWLLGWLKGKRNAIKQVMLWNRKLIQPVHAISGVVALVVGIAHGVLVGDQHWLLWTAMGGMGFLTVGGALLQWKYTPKKARKHIYAIHSQQLFFVATIALLVIGHQIVD